jgi:hypothetical protein
MFCNHCGAPNADGSRFCAACGLAITSPSVKAAPVNSLNGVQTETGLTTGVILNNRYRIVKELGLGGMGARLPGRRSEAGDTGRHQGPAQRPKPGSWISQAPDCRSETLDRAFPSQHRPRAQF